MNKCIFIFYVLISLNGFSQNWSWAHKINTYNGHATVKSDKNGNAILFGQVMPPAVFNHKSGVHTENNIRAFVSKYDINGNLLWLSGGTGAYTDMSGLDIDEQGNCYQTGSFFGTVAFGKGPDTIQNSSSPDFDRFLVRLDANGGCDYFQSSGDSCGDYGASITALKGNTLIHFDADQLACDYPDFTTKVNFRKFNAFNGNVIDTFQFMQNVEVANIAATNDGGFLMFGRFLGISKIFGLTTSASFTSSSQSAYDCYFVKYDSMGEIVWSKTIQKGEYISGFTVGKQNQITVQLNSPYTLAVDNVTIAPGQLQLLQFDPQGNYLNHVTINTPLTASAHQTDSNNNIYLYVKTGYSLAVGADTINWNPATPGSIFAIVKLDSNLKYQWSEYLTGYSGMGRISVSDSAIYLAMRHEGKMFGIINGVDFESDGTSSFSPGIFIAAIKLNNPILHLGVNRIDFQLSVFPNPLINECNISCSSAFNSIKIWNLLGECVTIFDNLNTNTKRIDLQELPPGVYCLELAGADFNVSKKIILK